MCEYEHTGVLKFQLNRDMTDFLLELKGDFTQPLLEDFLKMKSHYSMAIWHLMQREMMSKKPGITNIIEFDLTIEELRKVTGTQDKLKQIGEFKKDVLIRHCEKLMRIVELKLLIRILKKGVS